MKKRIQKLAAALMAGMVCIAVLGGCGSEKKPAPAEQQTASVQDDTEEQVDSETGEETSAETEKQNLGSFTMEDIEGETYTEAMFADYELTMVNLFTTWCTPCINEIPDLEQLRKDMEDQGVTVVGVTLDAVGYDGSVDTEAVEKAKLLAERSGVEYPFLIPDKGNMNGRLYGVQAVPETFFVDKNGNIVGDTYTGSRSLEEWKAVVETVLSQMEGEAQ